MTNKIAIHFGLIPAALLSLSLLFITINFNDGSVKEYFFSFYMAFGIILSYITVNIKKFSFAFKVSLAFYIVGMILFMLAL